MRAATGIIASVLALALLTAPASMASAGHGSALRRCAPRSSTVISTDVHAELYRYGSGIYACLRSGGRNTHLGRAVESLNNWVCTETPQECRGVVSAEALAGDVVAYAYEDRLIVRSVATGATLHDLELNVLTRGGLVEIASALRIVVNSEGSVAWIQEDLYPTHDDNPGPPRVYDVFAVDSRGFDSLRVGLPAAPKSLKLAGNVLSWTQAGESQSAILD